ncbi:MAG: zinc ABC transporter substrate-binding protein [Pseudomonadota bacterium]|nr:zinc ABC transporter substrate-binding protein [Pseudomonadota bacterium]
MRLAVSLLATLLALAGAHAATAQPRVVASIKPVHSLVAAVMDGVGEPELIVTGAGSPHDYALRPSQARMIERGDLVFWIGEGLETFLARPLESLGGRAVLVELADTPGLTLLAPREGGAFEAHGHGDEAHEHESHEEGAEAHEEHEEHADHDDDAAGHEAGHDGHGAFNPHLWLDPRNAAAMLDAIADALATADPANAARYRDNARAYASRLHALEGDIAERLAPVKDRPFVVFHDAYPYFEHRFGLSAAGSITLHPEHAPGAERIAEIRARFAETDAACVFSEPQFEPRLVSVVIEGTGARTAELDPLGATLEPGPDLYIGLLSGMADSFAGCLGADG